MSDYLTHTKAAFDSASRTFDEDDNANGILLWMRARAYDVYFKHFKIGNRLLELNSGTGIDAIYLASKGIKVHCTDISTGMIEQLGSKVSSLGLKDMVSYELKPFDKISEASGSDFSGAISNFGGLNCIPDFTKLSRDLSSKLQPGGKFIAVVINKFCPWEIFYYLLKLKPRIAFRRLKAGGLDANLNGEKIRTFYFTPGEFAKDFQKEFSIEKIYSHGMYTPPPYLVNIYNRLKPLVKIMMKLDDITRGIFPVQPLRRSFHSCAKEKTIRMINLAWIISGFFADENDFGGVAAIHNLAKEISEHPGISLTVFAMYYPLGVREFELYGAKVFTFNSHSEPGLSWMQKLNLWRQLRKKFDEENRQKKFDLIHSFWAGEPGYVASKLSRKHNIPFIANICGGELANFPEINYGQQLNSRQQHFIKKTFDTASIIISGSDFITEIAGKMFDSSITSKVQKIPFGVDEKLFDPSLHKREVSQNQPVLINIANCVPVKAHSDLLKALAIVKQNYPNVLLKIYGLDEENYIMKTAKSLGLENNVQVNGSIDHRLIPQALASADVFVLSSLYESQNMAILEAAFMSLPVVSTDVGIAREITPYISTPGEHTVFAENIIKAINSPKPEYKDLREKFSLISISNKFTEMYVEMMNKS